MAETPEQRRQRYLRDRQLKGRVRGQRTAAPVRRIRFGTGGEWTGGEQKEQYAQDKSTGKLTKATEYRFVDESIKIMRREYTETLRKKLAELRQKLEGMTPEEQSRVREAIRELYARAHEQRQRYIQYRASQRGVVRTSAGERQTAATAAREG